MRNIIRTFALVALYIVFGSASLACQAEADFEEDVPPEPGPSELPNIIFILADDLDTRSVSHMPGLESLLVEEGTTFVNALATASPMPALDHQACAVSCASAPTA